MSPRPGMSPLSIVLPHPALPRKRSSLFSAGCASPHTPRSCASPTCSIFFAPNNRKSSDSWGSSNQDIGDDVESDWQPEHVALLQRTLDALPTHLFTPYIGQIPPPNLIEKIAKGVIEVKASEWTHSLRATRLKLFEIARKSAIQQHRRSVESTGEETNSRGDDRRLKSPGKRALAPRPLYRQSSMDFINPSVTSLRDTDSPSKLSNRLHPKSDRTTHHPYTRAISRTVDRSHSPPRIVNMPSLINPSTQSLSTRNSISSLSSISSRSRVQTRSRSSLSRSSFTASSSDRNSSIPEVDDTMLETPIEDPRVQRVRRSESFGGPPTTHIKEGLTFSGTNLPSPRQGLKRSPSYGVFAQGSRTRGTTSFEHSRAAAADPSSDEEEKLRAGKVKKAKTSKKRTQNISPSSSTSVERKAPDFLSLKSPGSSGKPKPRMSLQRNPSIFGPELPSPPVPSSPAATVLDDTPATPVRSTNPPRTLRRVKRLTPPARKIEFGNERLKQCTSSDTDGDVEGEGDPEPVQRRPQPSRRLNALALGSAIKLK